MTLYALVGATTRDLLTYRGRVIVHDNRTEMAFLLPNARTVPVTDADLVARSPLPPIPLREHPDMAAVQWPLTREQFQ